jgi:hypothetical protein
MAKLAPDLIIDNKNNSFGFKNLNYFQRLIVSLHEDALLEISGITGFRYKRKFDESINVITICFYCQKSF